MKRLKRSELNALIGKNDFFSSPESIRNELYYESGLPCFEELKTKINKVSLSLIAHPSGIEITNSGEGIGTGIRFDEIEGFVSDSDETGYYIELILNQNRSVILRFYNDNYLDVVEFLQNFNIQKEQNSIRTEEEISTSKDPDHFVGIERTVKTTVYGTKKDLIITKETIRWGKTTIDVKDCVGFGYGKHSLQVNAIKSSLQYNMIVYMKTGKPLKIRFTTSFGIDKNTAESIYSKVIETLSNLIVLPQMDEWFQQLSENKVIDMNILSLRREGLIINSIRPDVYIPWEDIDIKQRELSYSFHSKTDKKLILVASIQHNYEVNSLLHFLAWLFEDEGRLIKLTW
ncbi:MAG: hypothetical protein QNK23_10720 [Crocinitomicaceae bacterium]|nr:hypothetical protein [Crocinitomicaceae bacterium]